MPTSPMAWQPDLVNPLMGEIQWPVPDNHTISVTLFKDPRTHELEDKDWTFVVEDVSVGCLLIALCRREIDRHWSLVSSEMPQLCIGAEIIFVARCEIKVRPTLKMINKLQIANE